MPAQAAQRAGVPSPEDPAAESRSRVLLVDDSPENLISLEAALEGLGADLVCAGRVRRFA